MFIAPDTLVTPLPEFDETPTAGPEEVTSCEAQPFSALRERATTHIPRRAAGHPDSERRPSPAVKPLPPDWHRQFARQTIPSLHDFRDHEKDPDEEEPTQFFSAQRFSAVPEQPMRAQLVDRTDWDEEEDEEEDPTFAAPVGFSEAEFLAAGNPVSGAFAANAAMSTADIAATEEAMRAFEEAALEALAAAEDAALAFEDSMDEPEPEPGPPHAPRFQEFARQARGTPSPEYLEEEAAKFEVPWFVTNNPPAPGATPKAKEKFLSAVPQTLMTIPAEQARAMIHMKAPARSNESTGDRSMDADCRPRLARWLRGKKKR